MKILIDGEEVKFDEQATSFTELLAQVSRVCRDRQRVITQMEADNRRIFGGAELPSGLPFEKLTVLEVTTGPTREVATGVLRGCAEHMARLSEGFALTATKLREGATQEGLNHLVDAITLWLELASGTDSAMQIVGLDWASIGIHPANGEEGETLSAEVIVAELNALLEEVQRTIEDQDYLELVDILEYDLPPMLKGYQEALFLMVDIASKPVN